MTIGKTAATRNPFLRLSPNELETALIIVGPAVQPRSPPKANSANIMPPPFGILPAARLNVPGQKIPQAKPQTEQAINAITGFGTSEIHK